MPKHQCSMLRMIPLGEAGARAGVEQAESQPPVDADSGVGDRRRGLLAAKPVGVVAVVALVLLVLAFASWAYAQGASQFLMISLNGVTYAAQLFLVASGLTLIFGVLRVVNLAHGSLYLLGGYLGFTVLADSNNWWLGLLVGTAIAAACGLTLQQGVLRWMPADDLRQALATIGVSVVAADQLLAHFGGLTYSLTPPGSITGSVNLHLLSVNYPAFRLAELGLSFLVGLGLWALLKHTRTGVLVRAGVDDEKMLAALGVNVQAVFAFVFTLGAALAGLGGVVGGTALSIAPGDDDKYLLLSLVVVIVGGMGSITGAALGSLLVGLLQQYGLGYFPTYASVLTFGLLVVVLAVRPRGILGGQSV